MKKHLTKLFALVAMTICSLTIWADNVNVTVSNDAELKTAYETAFKSKDVGSTVITMNTGSYECAGMSYKQLQFPRVRSITLQAAEDAEVTLTTKVQCDAFKDSVPAVNPAGSLTFKGLTIRSTNDNFITIQRCGNIDHISFIDCDITGQGEGDSHEWHRYIINSGNASYTLNTISFDGCTIHDMGNGYNLLPITHKVQNVSVTNSTLYNYKGDKFFNPQTDTDEVFTFTFNNNTVYKWGTSSHKNGICHIDGKCTNASNVITFKDNIFWGKNDSETPTNSGYLLHAGSGSKGTLIEQNNLLYKFEDEENNGTFTKTINNLSYTGDVPFWDAAAYDFRILSISQLATASTTGGVIGAPKWLANAVFNASVLPLSRCGSVSLSGTGVLNAGKSVTATATANYGYSFVKWEDANGTLLSTENPYVFTSAANATVNAVFEINTTVYQELPLSSASAYMDLSQAITIEGAIETKSANDDAATIPYYQSTDGYIRGIPANGASASYVEFKVHNTTEGWYTANFYIDWTNTTDPTGNYSYPTITITDDETGDVVEQSFGLQGDNEKSYRITVGKITTGYKTIRYFFNNMRGGNLTSFQQINFTANTYAALPLASASTYLDLNSYSAKHNNLQYYSDNDGSIGSVKNGYYVEYYINNENATAHYDLRMGVTQHNEGTMNVTITDVKTDTNEATGSFTITEGSNYENITYTLTGDITPGIKKIRFDFAINPDAYILNFNHVTFVKDDGGATAIEETNANANTKAVKFIRNGQLVIIRDGVEYNALGNRL